jgi:cytoskeletal protein CcmA (bactofilin family)
MFGRRTRSYGASYMAPGTKPKAEETTYPSHSSSMPSMGMTMSNNRNAPPPMRPEIAPRRRVELPGIVARPGEAPEQPATEGKKLLVGRDIFLTGEITACNKLVIEGRVEASMAESQSIDIAATGHFKGNAEADTAEVSGRFEGKLLVRKRLTIRSTGRVVGEIRYGEIEIECGGVICGDIRTVEDAAGAAAPQGESGAQPEESPQPYSFERN